MCEEPEMLKGLLLSSAAEAKESTLESDAQKEAAACGAAPYTALGHGSAPPPAAAAATNTNALGNPENCSLDLLSCAAAVNGSNGTKRMSHEILIARGP
ncbi:hypothetical protein GN956_G22463 [Arapaima gigas]